VRCYRSGNPSRSDSYSQCDVFRCSKSSLVVTSTWLSSQGDDSSGGHYDPRLAPACERKTTWERASSDIDGNQVLKELARDYEMI
jgi:hypothetical protein